MTACCDIQEHGLSVGTGNVNRENGPSSIEQPKSSAVIKLASSRLSDSLTKRAHLLVLVVGLVWTMPTLAEVSISDLRTALEDMAATHGFVVRGLDRIEPEPAHSSEGDLNEQLRFMLDRYDYVLLHTPTGEIEKVLITGRKLLVPAQPQQLTVETSRRGAQHLIEAVLAGPGTARRRTLLVVDTGATTVVLPASMIEELGYSAEDLHEGWAQTANGKVAAKLGTLRSVEVGRFVARDVTVTFVADDGLSGNKLLGLSFLERFRVTLDDAKNQLVLMAK